jgi:hypothetical protein
MPPLHEPGHVCPHPPQLFTSFCVSMQVPAQHALSGAVHWLPTVHAPQTPLTQACAGATQVAHAAPPVPHDPKDSEAYDSHNSVEPLQQPLGQEVELQMHTPLEHSWPLAQVPQVSVLPQPLLGEPQLAPRPEHVAGAQTQTPFWQDADAPWPAAHAAHAAPPLPQLLTFSLPSDSHALPLQQPVHPELVVHTHVPPAPEQIWPAPQSVLVQQVPLGMQAAPQTV